MLSAARPSGLRRDEGTNITEDLRIMLSAASPSEQGVFRDRLRIQIQFNPWPNAPPHVQSGARRDGMVIFLSLF